MQVRHTSVVMWCSERENRAYEVEIAYSRTSAVVERVIALPLGYELFLDRQREGSDAAIDIPVELFRDVSTPCPYCQQTSIFICECGARSCWTLGKRVHCCPRCGDICKNIVPATRITGTRTGLESNGQGSGRQTLRDTARPQRMPEPRRLPPPDLSSLELIKKQRLAREQRRLGLPAPKSPRRGIAGLLPWFKG